MRMPISDEDKPTVITTMMKLKASLVLKEKFLKFCIMAGHRSHSEPEERRVPLGSGGNAGSQDNAVANRPNMFPLSSLCSM